MTPGVMAAGMLKGRGIVVTRPANESAHLAQLVRDHGGNPILFPALEIAPVVKTPALRDLIARLEQFDLAIFISPSAVNAALDLVEAQRTFPAIAIAAVGAGSVRTLEKRGFSNVIAPTEQFDSEALLALPALQHVQGKRIVIFRGVGGRELLAETLTARGAQVEYAECYQRVRPQNDVSALLANEIHAVTATSSEGVRNLFSMLNEAGATLLKNAPWFVTHQRIAQVAKQAGVLTVVTTAQGDQGLLEGLLNWFTA